MSVNWADLPPELMAVVLSYLGADPPFAIAGITYLSEPLQPVLTRSMTKAFYTHRQLAANRHRVAPLGGRQATQWAIDLFRATAVCSAWRAAAASLFVGNAFYAPPPPGALGLFRRFPRVVDLDISLAKPALAETIVRKHGAALRRLVVPSIDGIPDIADLGVICAACPHDLALGHLTSTRTLVVMLDLSLAITFPPALVRLSLEECGISDLAPLAALLNLRMVALCACPAVGDLAPLAALPCLAELDVSHCNALAVFPTRAADAARWPALVTLVVLGCRDLTTVGELPLLARFNARDSGWRGPAQFPKLETINISKTRAQSLPLPLSVTRVTLGDRFDDVDRCVFNLPANILDLKLTHLDIRKCGYLEMSAAEVEHVTTIENLSVR